MKRRDFIKKSSLAGGALLFSPSLSLSLPPDFSQEELTGYKDPPLYGDYFKTKKEVLTQYEEMRSAAKKDGFHIFVASSHRGYKRQNLVWERKYKDFHDKQGLSHLDTINKIIQYTAIPGTSRHHWGTELDIIDHTKGIPENPLQERFFNKGGQMHGFKLWLDENSEKFGFYLVYTDDPDRKGVFYEPWHFSYRPISIRMMKAFQELDIKGIINAGKLRGQEYFTDEFIDKYIEECIFGINPELIP